tara:strand:- start:347 stop:736 length:390 start_codon:yes stop_codon:yes gene_type:complete
MSQITKQLSVFKSHEEGAEEINKHIEEMNKFFNVFICEDGYPYLELDGYYQIELSRICNQTHLLNWICHLSEKRWIDCDKISELICRVTWLFDLNINSYPSWDQSYQKDSKWLKVKKLARKATNEGGLL